MNDRPLRILRVVQSTYPEVVGGVGLHAHQLSKVQTEMGHEVTVLTTDNGDRSKQRKENRAGYSLIRHREFVRPFDNSITPGIVRSVSQLKSDYDVIHAHSHLYFMSNVTALLNSFTNTPLVLTNHGLISQTAPMWLQKVFNPTVGRYTFELADRVLCYTETDRDRLRDRGVTTDISIVHNGIDCDQFSPISQMERKDQVLFVGRLKEGKGAHHLIKAFNEVVEEKPSYSLKLIGDGPMRSELECLTEEYSISESVHFLGELDNEVLIRHYNESDVFALPSRSEGLPRTVLEAMSCETPVVTSKLPQLKPIVDGAGILVPPNDPSELTRAILELLADPELRAQLGRSGRERVKQNYSWTETVRQTTKCYHDLLYQSE